MAHGCVGIVIDEAPGCTYFGLDSTGGVLSSVEQADYMRVLSEGTRLFLQSRPRAPLGLSDRDWAGHCHAAYITVAVPAALGQAVTDTGGMTFIARDHVPQAAFMTVKVVLVMADIALESLLEASRHNPFGLRAELWARNFPEHERPNSLYEYRLFPVEAEEACNSEEEEDDSTESL
jgi:hypothetical protein